MRKMRITAIVTALILVSALGLSTLAYYNSIDHSGLGIDVNIDWNIIQGNNYSSVVFYFNAPLNSATSNTKFMFNNTGQYEGLSIVYAGLNLSKSICPGLITIPYTLTNLVRNDTYEWNLTLLNYTFNGTYPRNGSDYNYISAPTGYYEIFLGTNNIIYSSNSLAYEVPHLENNTFYFDS
ncbi:MAG: hypothetical protein ACP5OC_08250 [Thermoplasmata archaeon]